MANRQLGGATLKYETLCNGSVSCGTLINCTLYGVHLIACRCISCSLHNCTRGSAVSLELCEDVTETVSDRNSFTHPNIQTAVTTSIFFFTLRTPPNVPIRAPTSFPTSPHRTVPKPSTNECPVCMDCQQAVTAWQCGHALCKKCCGRVTICPICRCTVQV